LPKLPHMWPAVWVGRCISNCRLRDRNMKVEDIHQVFVVGAGTMGQQIALQCATHGVDAIVYDISRDALDHASARIEDYGAQLVRQARLTSDQLEAAWRRISLSSRLDDAATADLVSESVPEDPKLKAEVFARLHEICPPRTVFTTNTSTLVPSLFAEATGRPAQFAALHFHQYVWDANLVDIMPHPGTAPGTVALLRAFARRIGQVPLVFRKESPKYVVNAILGAINDVALRLVADGVASVEDVDRAWMIVMKTAVGPFGSLDVVGLDTVWHIVQANYAGADAPERDPRARLIKDYVDKGWLGVKSGRGFYTYPDPAYARPDFLSGEA